ncbi:hypothetical protein C0J52_26880 [Blattella germanica]|nr:hypothetical protein C0J52_26880 [Blattella germanica]
MYTSSKRDYIFSDPLRQKFGKLTFSELQSCSKPNEFHYVCKSDMPIHTHVSGTDCEATLLQPTNEEVPISCELRVLKLQQTFWIPLDSGYEWLYVAPRKEILSTLCTGVLRSWIIDGRGRLELQPGCKGFGTHTTLYALSNTTKASNMTSDIIPISPIQLDCCFSDHEKESLPELNLNNISIDGVRYEAVRTSTEFIPATTAEPASDVTLMMQTGQRQDQVSLEDQPIGRRTRSQFRSSTWR